MKPPIQPYIFKAKIFTAAILGGFLLWASLAHLTSAALAPGVVKVDTYRKTVQHLDGGIVSEILVREGDAVKRGQVLVRLDDHADKASLNAVRGQLGALEAETAALKEQLPSTQEQLEDLRSLYEKGYTRKSQLFEVERTVLGLKGNIAANEKRLWTMREEEEKARAKLARDSVVAPQDGVIMNLQVHTAGGVINPGGTIADIVPVNDKLVLEAKIKPLDIDIVRPDLPATVRFVAYKQRTTPSVEGKVTRISPDAQTEERTGQTYFSATVEVESDQLAVVPSVKLYPGMPVEVAIVTGSHTMLDFLLQPLTDSFSHAFREE
ncbi:HlyD family efflux transporter periplasmic adaptor subunit [Methyloligella sp. 2.7D]|uniref:HlyD family efflux transporter periplasmic adaptor subunit n=1 Tax=unclassified Methyloligella TaxID=2625955 RepID=UPI00157CB64E|nr:HlyD family efflux transporter periplasmic adaptor subunit [Methyloligella sp. GL2]QKP76561.1 HlyD family efflux transporter periplasmic adaptor subunit [Methyloligella sp. GL2]